MSKKKRIRKLRQGIIGLTGASLSTSIGASVITTAGGSGAALGASSMTTIASFYPAMGSMMAGGTVLGMLGDVMPSRRKKRRRKR